MIGIVFSQMMVLIPCVGKEFILLSASRMYDCGALEIFGAMRFVSASRRKVFDTIDILDRFEVLIDFVFRSNAYNPGTLERLDSLRSVLFSASPMFRCKLFLLFLFLLPLIFTVYCR